MNVSGSDTKPPGVYKVSKDQPNPQLVLKGFEFYYEGRLPMDTNLELKGVWSPDGHWFLVLNQFNGKGGQELYAVNVETNEVRTVMEFEAPDLYVDGVDPVVWLK
jgi:Tol biopolymer transport system component